MVIPIGLIEKIRAFGCSGMFSDYCDGKFPYLVLTDYESTSTQVILARVRTVDIEEIETNDENLGVGLPFLTSMNEGEALLVKGSDNFAYFGELMANLAVRTGVVASVIIGASRDSNAIRKLAFPLFARKLTPIDIKGRGRVAGVDVPIEVNQQCLYPGDWLFADSDGIVLFSQDYAEEILHAVGEMIESEKSILFQISNGLTGAELAAIHKGF